MGQLDNTNRSIIDVKKQLQNLFRFGIGFEILVLGTKNILDYIETLDWQ